MTYTQTPRQPNGRTLRVHCEGCGIRMSDDDYANGAGLCGHCLAENEAMGVRGGQGRTGADVTAAAVAVGYLLASVAMLALVAGAAYGFVLLVRAVMR